jgi:hypothetical protein
LALLEKEGVDAVFLPSVAAMYPPDYQTSAWWWGRLPISCAAPFALVILMRWRPWC